MQRAAARGCYRCWHAGETSATAGICWRRCWWHMQHDDDIDQGQDWQGPRVPPFRPHDALQRTRICQRGGRGSGVQKGRMAAAGGGGGGGDGASSAWLRPAQQQTGGVKGVRALSGVYGKVRGAHTRRSTSQCAFAGPRRCQQCRGRPAPMQTPAPPCIGPLRMQVCVRGEVRGGGEGGERGRALRLPARAPVAASTPKLPTQLTCGDNSGVLQPQFDPGRQQHPAGTPRCCCCPDV